MLEFSNKIYKFNINSSVEEFRIRNWGGEKEYTADIMVELKKGSTFYDIGSSVGLDTILASGKLQGGKVVAFEPDIEIFGRLQKNIALNNRKNVIALKSAVGDRNGSVYVYSKGADNFSPRLIDKNALNSIHKTPVYKIDTLLAKKQIPYPDVVKIDVEGFEKQVLLGMKGLLKSKRKPKIIFLEIHPIYVKKFNSSVSDILDFILQYSYNIIYIKKVHNQLLCKFNLEK